MVMRRTQNPEAAIRLDNVPVPMVFALACRKHSIEASICHYDMPHGLFMGAQAKFSK